MVIKRLSLLALSFFIITTIFTSAIVLGATWEFRFPTTCTDNTSTSRTIVPVMLGYGGSAFSGYIDADGLNTNMQIGTSDINYMMSTGNVTAIIPSLPANGSSVLNLYTGYAPDQTTFPIIPGYQGYYTMDDDADLECSDNFTIEVDGYIDTSAGMVGEDIFRKEDAISCNVTAAGEVTAYILTANRGWLSPTSFVDPDTKWINEANAYDSDNTTYAQTSAVVTDAWDSFLELYIAEMWCDSIRVWTMGVAARTSMDIDYYNGTDWVDLYEGGGANEDAWTEIAFPSATLVSGMRFRQYITGTQISVLNEAEFHESQAAASVTATGVSSGEHTILTGDEPTLHFTAPSDSISQTTLLDTAPALVTFELWFCLDEDFTAADASQFIYFKNNIVGEDRVGLNLQNGTGYLYAWGEYNNEGNWDVHSDATSWSADTFYYVVMTYDGTTWRMYIDGVLQTDTDTSNGFMNSGTEGDFYFGSLDGATQGFDGQITEFRVYDVTLTQSIITSHANGDYSTTTGCILHWPLNEGTGTTANDDVGGYDGTIGGAVWGTTALKIYIDDVFQDVAYGASVPDNANDWIIMSEATPYLNYYKHYVEGTLIAWHEPNAMLSGGTIPDRQGGEEPGEITWGSNDGIEIVYGAMVGYDDTYIVPDEEEGFTMPAAELPEGWFAAGGSLTGLIFYDKFSEVATDIGMPVQNIYFIIIVGLAMLAFLFIVTIIKSAFIGFMAMVIVLFIGTSMTVVPMWIPFTTLIVGFAIMYLFRQVSYG